MIAEGVQHAPQVTGRTMAPGSAAGARFQTQFVAQRPSIGSAAALKQTKKSLMGEIKRRRAAGMAAPNRKRQRNTGGAVRRAEMRVFGSIVRRSVAGRWQHQHAGLFGYALRQYAGGLVRRRSGHSDCSTAARRPALHTIPAAPENRSSSTIFSAAERKRRRPAANKSFRAYFCPTSASTNAIPPWPVKKPSAGLSLTSRASAPAAAR